MKKMCIRDRYYTSVEVSPGDSLWSIAERYLDDHYKDHQKYISEVVSINHLEDDSITSVSYTHLAAEEKLIR